MALRSGDDARSEGESASHTGRSVYFRVRQTVSPRALDELIPLECRSPNLGYDARAKEAQPVAAAFGPRWLDGQRSLSPEEAWSDCRRHARNLLGEMAFEALEREISGVRTSGVETRASDDRPRNLFGEAVPVDLFGNPLDAPGAKSGRRKR